jgi:hypothetical protein
MIFRFSGRILRLIALRRYAKTVSNESFWKWIHAKIILPIFMSAGGPGPAGGPSTAAAGGAS